MLLASLYVSHLDDHEKSMAKLYEVFAEKLPDMSDFWTRIAHDEMAHSGILRTLNFQLKDEKIGFSADGFAVDDVRKSQVQLLKDIDTFTSKGISREAALEYALKLERGIVEHSFFEIFETFTPNMRTEFNALRKHTEEHIKRIENAMDIQNDPSEPEEIS